MSTQHLPRGIVLALAACALVACGEADTGVDPGAGDESSRVDPQVRSDELAEHEGRSCPERLAGPGDGEVVDPAPTPPSLDEAGLLQPDEMWVCDYALVETRADPDRDGSVQGWVLRDPAVLVPSDQRQALLDDLTALEPAGAGRLCTEELGPRRLLVLSTDGDLTGIVVDDFGCRDVRMTDNPHETVPGEASSTGTSGGTVPGVLTGPEKFVDRVAALVR